MQIRSNYVVKVFVEIFQLKEIYHDSYERGVKKSETLRRFAIGFQNHKIIFKVHSTPS